MNINLLNNDFELLTPSFNFTYPFYIQENRQNRYQVFIPVFIIKKNDDDFKVVLFFFKKYIEHVDLFNKHEKSMLIESLIQQKNMPSFFKPFFTNLQLKYGEYRIKISKYEQTDYFYFETDLEILVKYVSGIYKKLVGNLNNYSIGSNIKSKVLNWIPTIFIRQIPGIINLFSDKSIKNFLNYFIKDRNGKILCDRDKFEFLNPSESKGKLNEILSDYFKEINTFNLSNLEEPEKLTNNNILKLKINNLEKEIKKTQSKIKIFKQTNENLTIIHQLERYLSKLIKRRENIFVSFNENENNSENSNVNESVQSFENNYNLPEKRINKKKEFIDEINNKQKEAIINLKNNVTKYGYLISAQIKRLYNEYNLRFKITLEDDKKKFVGDTNNYMDLYKNFVRIMVLFLNEDDVNDLLNNMSEREKYKNLNFDTFYNLFTNIIYNTSYINGANGHVIKYDLDILNIDNNDKIWISHIYLFGNYFDFEKNSEFINRLSFIKKNKINLPVIFDIGKKEFIIKYKEFSYNLYHIFNYAVKNILNSNGNYCLYYDNLFYIIEKLKNKNTIEIKEFYLLYRIIRTIFDFNHEFLTGKFTAGERTFKNGIRPNFYFMGDIVSYGKYNILEQYIMDIRHNPNNLEYYLYQLSQMTISTMYKKENIQHLINFEALMRKKYSVFRNLSKLIDNKQNKLNSNLLSRVSENIINELNKNSESKKIFRNKIQKIKEQISLLKGDLVLKYKKNYRITNELFFKNIEKEYNKQKWLKNKKIKKYLELVKELNELKKQNNTAYQKQQINDLKKSLISNNDIYVINLIQLIQIIDKLHKKIDQKPYTDSFEFFYNKQQYAQYFNNEREMYSKYFVFYNRLQNLENVPNYINILINTQNLINIYNVSIVYNLGNYPILYSFNKDSLMNENNNILTNTDINYKKNMVIFNTIKRNQESILEYEINVLHQIYKIKFEGGNDVPSIEYLKSINIFERYQSLYDILKQNFTKLDICDFFYSFGIKTINEVYLLNNKLFGNIIGNENFNIELINELLEKVDLPINYSLLTKNNLNIKYFEEILLKKIRPYEDELKKLLKIRQETNNKFRKGEQIYTKIEDSIKRYINSKYGKDKTIEELEAKYKGQFIKDSKLKNFIIEKKRLKHINNERTNFDDLLFILNTKIEKQKKIIENFKQSPIFTSYINNIKRATTENKKNKYVLFIKSKKFKNILNSIIL